MTSLFGDFYCSHKKALAMLLNFSEKLMPLALDSDVLSVLFGWGFNFAGIPYTLPETNMAPENNPPGKGDAQWKPLFLVAIC